MFIPTTEAEVRSRGWDSLDVILVSGDTYTDNSYNGTAIIGHWLIDHGFRVGIIAQPRTDSGDDIARLGQPELFWSVSAGCVDSMVANYTPTNKFRKDDDFTPGGVNDRRPDRATIAYTNLIKKFVKGKPILLAGVEASLRRIAHYDAWSDSVRRSVLFDAKADGIIYGMAELATLEVARCMRDGKDWHQVRGVCYATSDPPKDVIELPSYEDCAEDRLAFHRMFRVFYDNNDPVTAATMVQKHGNRYLVHNRPQRCMTSQELDSVYESDYENAVHPYYAKDGDVKAMHTIQNSVTTHRGCYGACSFCAIAVHQGRTVVSRSEDSIVREIERMASKPGFNGTIQDVGGPTANMYGIECPIKVRKGVCRDRRCLAGEPCPRLPIDHSPQIRLLRRIREIPGVKKVFVNSGIRYDMILADRAHGSEYLDEITAHHVSGQMKIAPEHTSPKVLKLMGKPNSDKLVQFKQMFDESTRRCGKDQFLTYYFMAAHPGCTLDDMKDLADFCHTVLRTNPEQVQVFTPTPSTVATMIYHTRKDLRGNDVKCEHSMQMKQKQKEAVVPRKQENPRNDGRGTDPRRNGNKKPDNRVNNPKDQSKDSYHGQQNRVRRNGTGRKPNERRGRN